MALVNHTKKEVNAKIVFFGPESVGKATNLHHIYGKLKEPFRGAFKSMNLQEDRMLFFDFVPSGQGTLNGYRIRFHVYTMTGGVGNASSWKMVLKGADGVVFVADSNSERMAANRESYGLLCSCLAAHGKSISDIPCLVQCNKRDLSTAAGLDEMRRLFDIPGLTLIPAEARKGEGVLESIFTVAKTVMKNLKAGGLELDRQTEQLQGVADMPSTEQRPLQGRAGAEFVEAEAADPYAAVPGKTAEIQTAAAQADESAPMLDLAGEPLILPGGGLRLPLTIRFDGREKKVILALSLHQDEG